LRKRLIAWNLNAKHRNEFMRKQSTSQQKKKSHISDKRLSLAHWGSGGSRLLNFTHNSAQFRTHETSEEIEAPLQLA
jgi:hypothetical protein